jgi:hypothetical protein
MSDMKTCGSCKFWKPYDAPGKIPVGRCGYVKMFWNNTEWDDETYERVLTTPEHKAYVQDGSDYMASLITLPEFGCNQHESAPENNS